MPVAFKDFERHSFTGFVRGHLREQNVGVGYWSAVQPDDDLADDERPALVEGSFGFTQVFTRSM